MFRFTLRGLAIYIAFVGLTLALIRITPNLGVFYLIPAMGLAYSFSLISLRTYRFAGVGGLAGLIIAGFLLGRCAAIRSAESPARAFQEAWQAYRWRIQPYAELSGLLVGVTVGVLVERRRAAG